MVRITKRKKISQNFRLSNNKISLVGFCFFPFFFDRIRGLWENCMGIKKISFGHVDYEALMWKYSKCSWRCETGYPNE